MSQRKKAKFLRSQIKSREIEEDDDGCAVVKINITDADSLLSVYNDNGREVISGDTAAFIDNSTKPIPPKQDIHLKISCDEYTKDKERVYKQAISNYYVNEFAHQDRKLKNNLKISIILSIIAVVCFTLLYIMGRFQAHDVLYLLFDVFSWVFAWEAVDQFFLQRHFLKQKQQKTMQIIFAKITFNALKHK